MRRHQLCPQAFKVDLTSPRTFAKLELLHLDHEQDVAITCDIWVRAIAALCLTALGGGTTGWTEGSSATPAVLFGVRAAIPCTAPRCRASATAAPCHRLSMTHYRGLRDVVV